MIEKQLRDLLDHTLYVLQHPQASPRETVLLVGIAVVGLLAVLAFLSLFFSGGKKTAEDEEAPKEPRRKLSLAVDVAILSGALLLSVAVTMGVYANVSRRPSYCKSCHEMARDHRSWQQSSHRRFECANCHQEPGLVGYTMFKLRQLDMVLARLSRSYEKPIVANVTNDSCVQCHEKDIANSIVVSGLRVRHSDIIEAGYKCTHCHNTVGHGQATVNPRRPSMDDCAVCHNGEKVFSACNKCHVVDIGRKVGVAQSGYPATRLGPVTTCRGCHEITKCNQCHGLELPHPPDWLPGFSHAPAAAFERKEVCERCHSDPFCNSCHRQFPGHGPEWKRTHGSDGPYAQEGCLGCHRPAENFCAICHKQYRGIKVKLPKGFVKELEVPKGAKTF